MKAVLATAALACMMLAGCGGSDESEPETSAPADFEAPEGVELTAGGTTLELGESGTVVLDLGGGAASAATVEVTKATKGKIKDFRFFSLDAETKKSTPYYVRATVTNEGPAGLGGVSLPLLAHTDADTVYPASELVGEFKPCPDATTPKSFLAGKSATVCLIYFVPEGEKLQTLDLQPGEPSDAIRWTP
ncbi:hypothetical protein [Aeromicrobium sp. CTD01-1L150]|uniref:hypothetical protein n=1 Tax=Aeromicrobium sp. CTD01-1L150 TaxID=3341830 RepID=UPI0035BF6B6B